MGGGADGEDPGSPPPPEDAAGSFEAAGFDLEPETHPKDEPDNNPAQEEAHLSESIGTEDSASEEEDDDDSAPPVHPVQGDGEHGGWDTDDESIEVVGDDESIDDQVWQNIIAAHGVDGFDDSDDFDEESGEKTTTATTTRATCQGSTRTPCTSRSRAPHPKDPSAWTRRNAGTTSCTTEGYRRRSRA